MAPTRALAARVQQSWWQGAATLPMCSAYALGGTNGPALIESCILHTLTFDKWVTFTAVRSRCVWPGGVAEQMLSGLCAIAQLEMGYNATVSLAAHACQRAQSVASPERRENARHLDLFHRVYPPR